MDASVLLAGARAGLPGLLVALDFDGTLAPIVADPMDSRPVPGTAQTLTALAGLGAQVAVVTGRDARTVLSLSGLDGVPGLVVAGLYGAETWHDGVLDTPDEPPQLGRLRARLRSVVAAGPDGAVWIEDKRLSLVVHGRLAADPEGALDPLRGPVTQLADELGLEVHAGRDVLEVRLPGFDKARALQQLVHRHAPRAVLFAGDDVGDLPAFAAVRELCSEGLPAWGVGVRSDEVPQLTDAADLMVDNPAGLVELLRAIARI